MTGLYRDAAKTATFLGRWVRKKLKESGASGGVLGLSGGVDSAALAALLRCVCGRDGVLAVIMPCHSDPLDEEHALLTANALDIPAVKVDISAPYDDFTRRIEAAWGPLTSIARANVKPRMRMTALYSIAQTKNFLVFGASNSDELTFGYFTKHGDSGVDLLPFGDLLKGEVRALARHLGVPLPVIEKPPSAGLWKGQTDEGDMGVTYDELDRFIATGEGEGGLKARVREAFSKSEHKRTMPPIAIVPLPREARAVRKKTTVNSKSR